MKIRFVAEQGNKGDDDTEVQIAGIRDLPKFVMITAEDFQTPIGTGKAFVENNMLMIEADIREQEFCKYPTIGFEILSEQHANGITIIRESQLHTVSLQPFPNTDPALKNIEQQIEDGTALLLDNNGN